ncbi:hypothetical protein [Phaeodactylibacter xiamenensis]|uniref:hypothetical protein n=1 Tax=Phaeodactylibacter xiamenensis TaxID=1524460 RepID=UPI0024A7C521|nr:hypothetical protein [Phaeodactylibacter xiamenensis]
MSAWNDALANLGGGAWSGINQQAGTTPPASGNERRGFLNWLSNNYVGITEAGLNVACIFNPEKCRQTGTGTPVLPPQPPPPSGPSPYLLIAIAVVVVAVLIIILKR